jgi:hypothetical protein
MEFIPLQRNGKRNEFRSTTPAHLRTKVCDLPLDKVKNWHLDWEQKLPGRGVAGGPLRVQRPEAVSDRKGQVREGESGSFPLLDLDAVRFGEVPLLSQFARPSLPVHG